ncbi:MAG: cyclic nucleotide-binding domain-containing protein [Spirochaetales bacterium]|nr:cyclic nucleotide-binding domain-containing protein [Spirochaetales bacterium]
MRLLKDVYDKHVKLYAPGAVIFQEGDRGEELYIIIEGEVEIRKSTYTSTSKTLICLCAGDIFGEMSIIEKKARSATAVATKPTKLLVMNNALFERMIEKNPDFAKKMIKILSGRVRRANSILQNVMVTNKENQIISGMIQYAHDYGTPTYNGFRINVDKFVNWACDHLGILSEDLHGTIQDLLRKGIITYSALGKSEIVIKQRRKI